MAVAVPEGAVNVTVDWKTTTDVVVSRWLSGLGVLVFAGLCMVERRSAQRSVIMKEMNVDVKSLLKEGAELTDRALEELLPSEETVPASIHRGDAPLDVCGRQAAAAGAGDAGRRGDCRGAAERELSGWARRWRCCTHIR